MARALYELAATWAACVNKETEPFNSLGAFHLGCVVDLLDLSALLIDRSALEPASECAQVQARGARFMALAGGRKLIIFFFLALGQVSAGKCNSIILSPAKVGRHKHR